MKYFKTAIQISLVILMFTSCSSEDSQEGTSSSGTINCEEITADNSDDCLRLNHIQVIGTHNSYKLKPHPELVSLLNQEMDGWSQNIDYEHRPLTEQLEELGIRQFELDVFADTAGGLFSEPAGARMIGDESYLQAEEMMEPGFKVLHGQDLDYRTTCLTLKSCLGDIREWSAIIRIICRFLL